MIKSVDVKPIYEKWENLGLQQATGFKISIACGVHDMDEIMKVIKSMIERRYSIMTEEEEDDDD